MDSGTTKELIILDGQDGQPSIIINNNKTNDLNQTSTETVIKEFKINDDNVNVAPTNEKSFKSDMLKNATGIDKSKQRILVCVGIPGSGKSTFSKKLCQFDNVWYRVNQDDLGSRRACEDILRVQLNKGKNVIVDRCNFDKEQRKTWINLARRFNLPIDALIMDTPYEICEKRILKREDHPTQVYGKNGLGILKKFKQMFILPNYNEGFERILSVGLHDINNCDDDDVKTIMKKFDEIPKRIGRRGRGSHGKAKNSHVRNNQGDGSEEYARKNNERRGNYNDSKNIANR